MSAKPDNEKDFRKGLENRFAETRDVYSRYDKIRNNQTNTLEFSRYIQAYQRQPYIAPNKQKSPNFGQFKFRIDQQQALYTDIINDREPHVVVEADQDDDKLRRNQTKTITAAFHRYCIKWWTKRFECTEHDIFNMLIYGKGIVWWRERSEIYPENLDTERVFVDTHAKANPETWEALFIEEETSPIALWDIWMKTEGEHDSLGFHKKNLLSLIRNSVNQQGRDVTEDTVLEDFRKGNLVSYDIDTSITVVHGYIKEYDGSITRYMFTQNGDLNETRTNSESGDITLRKQSNYVQSTENGFSHICALRTDRIQKDYWNTRSYAQDIYIACAFYDLYMGKAARNVLRRLTVYLKSKDPDVQRKLLKMQHDEMVVLDHDTDVLDVSVNARWTEAIELVRQIMFDTDSNTGKDLATGSQNAKGRAITAREADIQLGKNSQVSGSKKASFINNDIAFYKELYNRFITLPSTQENKSRIDKFKRKMEKEGIPEDVYDPEEVSFVPFMAIGGSSIAEKLQLTQALMRGVHAFKASSTEGERKVAEEMIAAVVGWDNVEYYVHDMISLEISEHFKIGQENESMSNPDLNVKNLSIHPDDIHSAHIKGHIPDLKFMLGLANTLIKDHDKLTPSFRMQAIQEARNLLDAADNQIAHIIAHFDILMPILSDEDPTKPQMEGLKKEFENTRQFERKLEIQLTEIYQKAIEEDLERNGMTPQEIHEQRMRDQDFEHKKRMQALDEEKSVSKIRLANEGSEFKQRQSMRHKEEGHRVDQAIKVSEQETENRSKQNGDKEGD